MTHAFFKALLFMAAGIVIHALAGEQDIRKMGGLRRLMPFTYVAFLVGALSLSGIPPFSGFFSKDSILAAALSQGWYGQLLWVAGLIGTFLTGLYSVPALLHRLLGRALGLRPRAPDDRLTRTCARRTPLARRSHGAHALGRGPALDDAGPWAS